MAGRLNVIPVDGGQPQGPGSGESILDVEDVSAMAPGANIDVYEAPNTNAGALDEFAKMIDDDQDQIITSSWGFCEQDEQLADPGAQQAENFMFEQAAAQGQTILNAAGDEGDDSCNEIQSVIPPSDQNPLSVADPASQPYVLAVGGTTIQNAGQPAVETAWNDGAEWGGTGGGISQSWAMPTLAAERAGRRGSSGRRAPTTRTPTASRPSSAGRPASARERSPAPPPTRRAGSCPTSPPTRTSSPAR